MNLYRSFGNLMEAWMAEQTSCCEPEWLENNAEDLSASSSYMETTLHTDSVDSGVETASSDASFHATSCSVSVDTVEIDTTEREDSPELSCPDRGREETSEAHQKVEQALRRIDSRQQRTKPGVLTGDGVLRRQPKRHTSAVVRGQRSEALGTGRTVTPSLSEMCRRPLSMNGYRRPPQLRLEGLGEKERTGLSPGFCYLERVCQMLEESARQQIHDQTSQMGTDDGSPQDHGDVRSKQASDLRHDHYGASEDNLLCCQRLENAAEEQISAEPQRRTNQRYGHFRQRSASESTISTLHLGNPSADCRGQHPCIDEDDGDAQEETDKTNQKSKLKFMSLGRGESPFPHRKSLLTQSSEKSSARRRLSQLFRRTKKTRPASAAL